LVDESQPFQVKFVDGAFELCDSIRGSRRKVDAVNYRADCSIQVNARAFAKARSGEKRLSSPTSLRHLRLAQ